MTGGGRRGDYASSPSRGREDAVLFQTLKADIRATVGVRKYTGAMFWLAALGKLMFSPSVHVVVLYRLSARCYVSRFTRPLAFFLRMCSVVWGGTEIHPGAVIGPGFCIVHSAKVVIGEGVVIGRNVRVSHGVSIGGDTGRLDSVSGCPRIGDDVMVGVDAYIMGPVSVGRGAMVGAKSLVTHDVPDFGVVAGIPARLLRIAPPGGAT